MNVVDLADWVTEQATVALASDEAATIGLRPAPTLRWNHFGSVPELSWVGCCDPSAPDVTPGQMVAVIGRYFPSGAQFPQPLGGGSTRPSYPTSMAVPITVEIVRCTPTLDDQGNLPIEAIDDDQENRILESTFLVCHYQSVLGRGTAPDGYVVGVSSYEDGAGCKAVAVELMLHLA